MDARKKKVMCVLCVAGVVLVWRVYALLDRQMPPTSVQADLTSMGAVPPAPVEHVGPGIPVEDANGIWAMQDAVAAGDWGRDPFADAPGSRPREEPVEIESTDDVPDHPPDAPPLKLTAVSKVAGGHLAIVDGRIVEVGDTLRGEFTVLAISDNAITLVSGGWTFHYELGMDEAIVRRRPEEP